jgi:hypothetical protein
MILKQIALGILILCSFNGYSQTEYAVDRIPPTLKNRANAVIRKMETTVDMRSPDNVVQTVKSVITVLNKGGDSNAEIVLGYNKNTSIKYVKGIIYNADGKSIGKFALNNFTDHSAVNDFSLFQDDRLKHFAPSVSDYPYTISYEFEVRSKQNLVIPDWYANRIPDVSVEQSTYTFICKPTDKVRIKTYNYKGESEIVDQEKIKSQTWTVKNLLPFKYEPFTPDRENYLTCVKIAPEDFSYYGYKGKYQNWEELGKWIFNDLIKDRQVLNPVAVAEIKELVKDITNDKDKARKVYEYVQKKTRYISVQIGIGGQQPMHANEVHQLSYGDCKALVNYTQSLLKALDIPSWYCVVNAGDFKKDMEYDFASMAQGNHIILCLPLKGDTTWLECTSQNSPFGFLGSFTDDRTVLACREEGGKILKTPTLSTQMNLQNRKAALVIDANGNVNGSINTTFSGSQYDNYAQFENQPSSEQLKLLKKFYDVDNINFDSFNLSYDKSANPNSKEMLKLSIQKYAAKTNNNNVYLVLNAFNKNRTIPEIKNRTLPVFINRGYTDLDEITYTIPDNWDVEYLPEDIEIKNSFGSYSVSVKKEDKKLIYSRKMVLNNGTYSADKYADFSTFMNKTSSNDRIKAVLKIGLTQH